MDISYQFEIGGRRLLGVKLWLCVHPAPTVTHCLIGHLHCEYSLFYAIEQKLTMSTENHDGPPSDPATANGAASLSTAIPAPTSPSPLPRSDSALALSTLAIHADDHLPGTTDVAPPIHLSTNFAYPSDPALLDPAGGLDYCYSREATPTTTRLETLLAPLLGSTPANTLVYASGLAALHALYVALAPARVAVSPGYHGTHAVLALHKRLRPDTELIHLPASVDDTLELNAESGRLIERLGDGDIVHLETPTNPTGETRDVALHVQRACRQGAFLVVDGTFAPPGLQDAFGLGADVVMMSGTKYLGGHGDLLCGVVAVRDDKWGRELADKMRADRTVLGSVMGGLEAWLCVRSLRTLGMRVERQSRNAENLVAWLDGEVQKGHGVVANAVRRVRHASLQLKRYDELGTDEGDWLREQMPKGFGPVFAMELASEGIAKRLPSCLKLFVHATSLGGVESLIEWRIMSDSTADPRLIRISVGCEAWDDLKADLERGFGEALKLASGAS